MQVSRPRRDGPIHGPPRRGRFLGRVLPILALLAAGPLAGACGGREESPAPRPAAAAPPAATAPATRIVSLAPSHTELLFALGAGPSVVGVTRFCDRPPEARTRAVLGDARSVNLEALVALRPDLVVLNAEGVEGALGPVRDRVPVLSVPTDTLAQLLDAVDVLGRAAGRVERARALRASMEGALADARARNAGRPRTRVLVVVQQDPWFVAGGGSYVHTLLEALGCENAAGDLADPWPTLSAEAVLARSPDAVVDAALGSTGRGAADADVRRWWEERFPHLPAVAAGRVRALRDEAILRPGPDLEGALRALEEAVGPPPPAGGPR